MALTGPRQLEVFPMDASANDGRRKQGGEATSAVIRSAIVGGNDQIFPSILDLHVPVGSVVADVTFGRGVFWKAVDRSRYRVLGSDLALEERVRARFPDLDLTTEVNFSDLPYEAGTIDALVLDPPYMEGFYRPTADTRAGQGTHASFQQAYSSGTEVSPESAPARGRLAWQDRVVDAYLEGASEAHRVLRDDGVMIVKCQDAVSANLQRLAHVEIITACEELGFYCKDLFVVVRPAKPSVSRIKTQVHARKNHSYFLVFVKPRRNSPVSSCRACRRN